MLNKPIKHIVVLRCPACKERFQTEANNTGDYQCPHCEEWFEYAYHKPNMAEAIKIGPSENK